MHAIRTTPRRSPWPWIVGAAALMGGDGVVGLLHAAHTRRRAAGHGL